MNYCRGGRRFCYGLHEFIPYKKERGLNGSLREARILTDLFLMC